MDDYAEWMEDDEPLHLPPPIFSKVDMSQNYRFLANPLFKITQEKNEKGEVREYRKMWEKYCAEY